MCTVDYDHELGNAPGGVEIFKSVDDAKAHLGCAESCGLYEVEVRKIGLALEGDGRGGITGFGLKEDDESEMTKLRKCLKHYQERATAARAELDKWQSLKHAMTERINALADRLISSKE